MSSNALALVNAIAPIAGTRMMAKSIQSATDLAGAAAVDEVNEVMGPLADLLDPALVAPVVAFLAHRDCAVSGEFFTVGGGHVAQFFIGRTKGYFNPTLSVEDVAAHFQAIRDRSEYSVPGGCADEMAELFAALAGERGSS